MGTAVLLIGVDDNELLPAKMDYPPLTLDIHGTAFNIDQFKMFVPVEAEQTPGYIVFIKKPGQENPDRVS